MRNTMAGFAILGALTLGAVTPVSARSLAVSSSVEHATALQRVGWDNCGPRCQEQRREVRARERERQRLAQHRREVRERERERQRLARHRWEEHRRWEQSHQSSSSRH